MGRTCGIVRGCVYVPVGDGPVGSLFCTRYVSYHTDVTSVQVVLSIVGVLSCLLEMALIFFFQ